VHSPESEGEKVFDSIRLKATEHGLDFPIAVDSGMKTWQAWSNSMWPSVYLIDKRGLVRYWWYGELNWKGSEGEVFMREKIEEFAGQKNGTRIATRLRGSNPETVRRATASQVWISNLIRKRAHRGQSAALHFLFLGPKVKE